MTPDNIKTRRLYARAYWNMPMSLIELDLDTIEVVSNILKFDDMIDVRKLMDEKIPLWK
jgi:hypothetical protein